MYSSRQCILPGPAPLHLFPSSEAVGKGEPKTDSAFDAKKEGKSRFRQQLDCKTHKKRSCRQVFSTVRLGLSQGAPRREKLEEGEGQGGVRYSERLPGGIGHGSTGPVCYRQSKSWGDVCGGQSHGRGVTDALDHRSAYMAECATTDVRRIGPDGSAATPIGVAGGTPYKMQQIRNGFWQATDPWS